LEIFNEEKKRLKRRDKKNALYTVAEKRGKNGKKTRILHYRGKKVTEKEKRGRGERRFAGRGGKKEGDR